MTQQDERETTTATPVMDPWPNEPPGAFGARLLEHLLKIGDAVSEGWAQYTANEESGRPTTVRDKQATRAMLATVGRHVAQWNAEITADLEAKGAI